MTFLYDDAVAMDENRDGAKPLFALKTQMKLAGWTVVATGDGDSNFAVGSDVITNNGVGANGIKNDDAWFCLQQPSGGTGDYAGTRQILIQGETTGGQWGFIRWIYSPGGTANTASITADRAPSFTDELFKLGGGTDAVPTYSSFFIFNTGGAFPFAGIAVGDAAENFGWHMQSSGDDSVNNSTMVFDPVTSVVTGDTDPFVLCAKASSMVYSTLNNQQFAACQMNLSGTPEFKGISLSGFPNPQVDLEVNRVTGKDDLFEVFYARWNGAPGGYKGVSSMLRWRSVNRNDQDTYTVSTVRDRFKNDDLVFKWGGGVVP